MAQTKIDKKLPVRTAKGKKTVTKKVEPKATQEIKKVAAHKKTLSGTVVSTKMQNTVVVAIERKVAHKLYRKLIKVTKKLKADSNNIDVKEGDVVIIEQTRPISKDKNFKVIKKEEAK